MLNVTIDLLDVKVKVEGQNLLTENLPFVIARPWFKICSPNLTTRLPEVILAPNVTFN